MTGIVPVIHAFALRLKDVGGRNKCDHDEDSQNKHKKGGSEPPFFDSSEGR